MKHLRSVAFLLCISLGMPILSQTPEIEGEIMLNRFKSQELSQLEFRDLAIAWRNLTDSIGYPDVPYDTLTKKVEYEFRNTFNGISHEIIVNRILEWAAISFGSTNSLLTSQGNSSRIIINGFFEILFPDLFFVYKNAWKGYVETELQNSGICYYTVVFTVMEGKMKSQVMNISYEYTDYISDRSISRTLNSCFPISNYKQDEWKDIISLVQETRAGLTAQNSALVNYVEDYENDYDW